MTPITEPLADRDAPPVCPRHPDRVSYVRCQRCGRPACPECQRQAPVGIHCVDCVAEAARALPATRTLFGGVARPGPPVATIAIVAVCVVSFVLQLASDGWTVRWLYSPALGYVEPWRFLTAAFLHSTGAIFHILLNMLALWMVGPYLEQALGRARFVTLYLMSAIGGSVAVLGWAAFAGGDWFQGVVGASGAIFGLFGAVFVVMTRLRHPANGILGVIVLNVVFSFLVPGLAWQAHIGGLVVGGLLAAAYAWAPAARRRTVAVVAPLALFVAFVVLARLAYATEDLRGLWLS